MPAGTIPSDVSWTYRIVFAMAALVAATAIAFFFIGIADGSVSSFNIMLWLGLLALVCGVPVAGWRLKAQGQRKAAIAVLAILAAPGLLYALFLLLVIGSGARWN